MFRIFWKNKRLHVKFRPYKYRKKLLNNEQLQKEQESIQELRLSKKNLSNIMHEMKELCEQVKHPDPEIIDNSV